MSSTNRRSFLARGAALAAVPTVAALAGGVFADRASADTLPNYAPIPPSALGPAVNSQGFYVGRVEKNLYWVTDATYQAAFLTTREGVVLFDAPPTIGHNLQRAIDQIASAEGVSSTVTHVVYSHHHADHLGASAPRRCSARTWSGSARPRPRSCWPARRTPPGRCLTSPSTPATRCAWAGSAWTWRGTVPTTPPTTSTSTFQTMTRSC